MATISAISCICGSVSVTSDRMVSTIPMSSKNVICVLTSLAAAEPDAFFFSRYTLLSCRPPDVDGDGGGDGCDSTDYRWRLLLRTCTSCAGDDEYFRGRLLGFLNSSGSDDDGGDLLDLFGLLRGASDSDDDGGDARGLEAGPLDVGRATKPSCGTLETAGLKR